MGKMILIYKIKYIEDLKNTKEIISMAMKYKTFKKL